MISNSNSSEQVQSIVEFLTAFHPEGVVTFQTIKDYKQGTGRDTTVNSLSLDELPSTINMVLERNTVERGEGVCFTVNRTDGLGRKTENIQLVTALFVDIDKGEPVNLDLLPEATFEVISSPGKRHMYWILNEPVCLSKTEFKELQQGLAELVGGDPKVCDIARVMRLPCSLHLKNIEEPYEVELVKSKPSLRYALDDLAKLCRKASFKSEAVVAGGEQQPTKKVERKKKAASAPKQTGKLNWKLQKALLDECAALKAVKEGERNDTLNKVAYKCGSLVRLGLDEDTVASELFSTGVEMGLTEEEVGASIDSALAAGTRKCQPFALFTPESKILRAKVLVEYTLENKVKYDSRNNELLYKGKVIPEQSLYLETVQTLDMDFSAETFKVILSSLVERNTFDPVADYLNSLPLPEKVEYLPQLCEKVFGVNDSLSVTYVTKWFVGAVSRALDPGCKFDLVLVLQGDQGTGKSRFFEELGTINGRHYKRELSASNRGKDELMTLYQSFIAEFSELSQQYRGRDLDAMKMLITSPHDDFRKPYASEVTSHPRRSVFAATTNDEECLVGDSSGNRRFCPIVTGSNIYDIEWLKEHKDIIWAEAVKLYKGGETSYLSRETMELQAQANKALVAYDPLTDVLSNLIHHWVSDTYFQGQDREGNSALFGFTSAEILKVVNESGFRMGNGKGDQMKLAGLLKNLGVKKNKTRDSIVWSMGDTYYRPKTGSAVLRKHLDQMLGLMTGALVGRD